MSYILDALRKADAQRERDPARGIHAQPSLQGANQRPAPAGYRLWLLAAIAVGVAAIASAAWYAVQDKPVVVVAATPVAPAVTMPAPRVATTVLPPPPAATVAVVQAPAIVQPSQMTQAPPPAPATPGAVRPEGEPRNMSTPPMRGAPQAGPGMEPPPATVTAPAPPVAGLPPDAPKLAISGGVYSTNASQRMLIVNGQVFNEGSEVGSGVVLEEIKPKSAVLRYRGSRYTVTY